MGVNGAVRIDVTDHGPGIHRDAHGLIFEKFGRVQGSTGKPGTGLGLFIAKRLVEMNGGRIRLESAQPTGAAFEILLPRAGD